MEFPADVNLQALFFFNKPEFHFVTDIEVSISDSEIWQITFENNWIILTKDADFIPFHYFQSIKPKWFILILETKPLLNRCLSRNQPVYDSSVNLAPLSG